MRVIRPSARRLIENRRPVSAPSTARRVWPGGPWPAAVAQARAELLLAEGNQQAAADALRRAAEGYAAAGQFLNERRAREALERSGGATVRV